MRIAPTLSENRVVEPQRHFMAPKLRDCDNYLMRTTRLHPLYSCDIHPDVCCYVIIEITAVLEEMLKGTMGYMETLGTLGRWRCRT